MPPTVIYAGLEVSLGFEFTQPTGAVAKVSTARNRNLATITTTVGDVVLCNMSRFYRRSHKGPQEGARSSVGYYCPFLVFNPLDAKRMCPNHVTRQMNGFHKLQIFPLPIDARPAHRTHPCKNSIASKAWAGTQAEIMP